MYEFQYTYYINSNGGLCQAAAESSPGIDSITCRCDFQSHWPHDTALADLCVY